jgi:hypothetical protein
MAISGALNSAKKTEYQFITFHYRKKLILGMRVQSNNAV